MNHSEHYPTFIEHPKDPAKRVIVNTPWLHHKQLKNWGLDGLDPEPAAPADETPAVPVFDPEYPKWIEHPNTKSRALVPHAAGELAQLTAWGFGPDKTDAPVEEDPDLPSDDTAPLANAWSPEWKGAQMDLPQCRTVRGRNRCLLGDGHAGNHQYKGAPGGTGNGN